MWPHLSQFSVSRARTYSMIVMIRLIVSSLFLTTINCQLAYVWLNYQHFQCSQNTRNYHESIRHQYLCTSSLICISDDNVYSHSFVIFLDYFCGFIDGQNALHPNTIWKIYLKPNINIQFLKFVLLDNYWYCDYEYLRVYSNNKTSTFCGNRIPWVYDASDTDVEIILMTQRFGTKNYQLELLYYGAYVPNYQHYIIFLPSSPVMNIHYPNTEKNAFESFHFISPKRLDIMELEAMNTCSKDQVVCYDGPGFKSPVLQFTYNQSVWQCLSSTFQMICKFSRVGDVCANGPHLYYRAIRARDRQVKNLSIIKGRTESPPSFEELRINEAHSKGTTKYIYYFPDTPLSRGWSMGIHTIIISFPYMLSEGNSCMYGGVYIVQSNSSKDSEILSYCTSHNSVHFRLIHLTDLRIFFVVIIHYSEYSTERIDFYALLRKENQCLDLNQKYKEETLSITVSGRSGTIHSGQLKLRKIQYINISLLNSAHVLTIIFYRDISTSSMNVTIFYSPHPSNIRGRQYDHEILSGRSFTRTDFIQSVFINMSAIHLVIAPVWTIDIQNRKSWVML